MRPSRISTQDSNRGTEYGGVDGLIQPPPHVLTSSETLMEFYSGVAWFGLEEDKNVIRHSVGSGMGGGSPSFSGGSQALIVVRATGGGHGVLNNILANPSAYGWPDETNTGVPPEISLSNVGPMVTSSHNQVIENLRINGGIEVAHDNVMIRNCEIIGPDSSGFPGNKAIIKSDGRVGLWIEYSEIWCEGPGSYQAAIGDYWITMRNCHIHDVPEGIRAGFGVDIEFCYIHSLIGNDPEAHSDLAQTTEGGGIRFHKNTMIAVNVDEGDATSAYICGPDLGDVEGVIFTDNLVDGGGYSLYFGDSTFAISDVVVTGNRIGRSHEFGPVSGDWAGISNPKTWADNVYDDDNTPIGVPTL